MPLRSAEAERLADAYREFVPPAPEHPFPRQDMFAVIPPVRAPHPAVLSFDWRSRISIRVPSHQGECYTCTSFALAAAIEANLLTGDSSRLPRAISAGYIHTCLAYPDETESGKICTNSLDLYRAIKLVHAHGCATLVDGDYPFPPQTCPSSAPLPCITAFRRLANENEAKNHIISIGPLVADMYIWRDFFSYAVENALVYIPDTAQEGPYLHAVCIVGFDTQGWIIKNSFGPDWGARGYATIPYHQCGLIDDRQTFGIRC